MKWTDEQISYLVENYDKLTNEEIANNLNKTYSAISQKSFRLGLRKPTKFFVRPNSGVFKKGHIPWNTGTKGLKKGSSTSYKKGNRPHNSYEGSGQIVLRKDNTGRKYKWLKLADSNFIQYHRYLWEQAYGEIPSGQIVVFKDGDSLNCELSNLELISRKENRIRNSSSTLLTDRYIVSTIIGSKKIRENEELADILLKNKELIELKRNQIKLRRLCKQIQE